MFVIATCDRESGSPAEIVAASTVEDAREKFIAAWAKLYDTSTVTLAVINADLSTTHLFLADTDGHDYDDDFDPDGEEDVEIKDAELARLDTALKPYAGT